MKCQICRPLSKKSERLSSKCILLVIKTSRMLWNSWAVVRVSTQLWTFPSAFSRMLVLSRFTPSPDLYQDQIFHHTVCLHWKVNICDWERVTNEDWCWPPSFCLLGRCQKGYRSLFHCNSSEENLTSNTMGKSFVGRHKFNSHAKQYLCLAKYVSHLSLSLPFLVPHFHVLSISRFRKLCKVNLKSGTF